MGAARVITVGIPKILEWGWHISYTLTWNSLYSLDAKIAIRIQYILSLAMLLLTVYFWSFGQAVCAV